MAGTKAGGLKAAATNKANNPNFYAEIGGIGGKNTPPEKRMFAQDKDLARRAGVIGGKISRRGTKAN